MRISCSGRKLEVSAGSQEKGNTRRADEALWGTRGGEKSITLIKPKKDKSSNLLKKDRWQNAKWGEQNNHSKPSEESIRNLEQKASTENRFWSGELKVPQKGIEELSEDITKLGPTRFLEGEVEIKGWNPAMVRPISKKKVGEKPGWGRNAWDGEA